MKCALDHDFALLRLFCAGETMANETNFVMNHAPDTGSITQLFLDSLTTHNTIARY